MLCREIICLYKDDERVRKLALSLGKGNDKIQIHGLRCSAGAFVVIAISELLDKYNNLIILQDKESAAYFYNDIENILNENSLNLAEKKVLFFPSSYRKLNDFQSKDQDNVLLRTEVLKRLRDDNGSVIVVTYPEALIENVIEEDFFKNNSLEIACEDIISVELLTGFLNEMNFDRNDFVVEPGQFALRGGIIDVFSYAFEKPFRIEFAGDTIESIRIFDSVSQLSIEKVNKITILPDMNNPATRGEKISFLKYASSNTVCWLDDAGFISGRIDQIYEKAEEIITKAAKADEITQNIVQFSGSDEFLGALKQAMVIEFGRHVLFKSKEEIHFNISSQPSFNKSFELLISKLADLNNAKFRNIIFADALSQLQRIKSILNDMTSGKALASRIIYDIENIALCQGFIDNDLKLACFTDHQIFDRYHRFRLRDSYNRNESITLKEIYSLNPGDYVTHIDHGIGRYAGLEKVEVNGRQQEAIKIVYENNDLLYVSIHSLHRIAKYAGKDGAVPSLSRLGSNAWNKLKNKTKQRVKDIAKELITLYAKRRASDGFSFSQDTYLQNELEASFFYQDTPDQVKTTHDVKKDMEAEFPMDRLVCGDVGFGKTEIAIRAAFKAVNDSKQVAILVPTTILALQHFQTFSTRLHDFPCKIEYLSRFRTNEDRKKILKGIADGSIDILIGTHRLLSKDIEFKDLGFLVIDEEQKFGVSAKEKLKELKVNVDTLTLTATPIPRTMQFSLMGARDLSIISTPPPNRYPVHTELVVFNEDIIREAIMYEVSRGGQVFFVHNRIQNINDIADLVRRLCPGAKVETGHGQMEGNELEKLMIGFIEGSFDVLVSTTIIESGLDIPNANTIIINDAHHYGLSDLHQLRGRVGRTNIRAFCYLLAPPLTILTPDARKRLKAIEEFSDLGSGFNIAMRDLDIRGAGNILGAEQSGFISEIGFEMYQKILDEAISELKESDFKGLYEDNKKEKYFIRDCVLETDLEILIPDLYISDISERLSLYKEIDSLEDEEGIVRFSNNLIDRFGNIPHQVEELLNALRLRRLARKLGIERIVMRDNKLIGYFINNPESEFYQSDEFKAVLNFVKNYPGKCRMKENNNKLSLTLNNIPSVMDALKILLPLSETYTVENEQLTVE